jgi:hypothetical protein
MRAGIDKLSRGEVDADDASLGKRPRHGTGQASCAASDVDDRSLLAQER